MICRTYQLRVFHAGEQIYAATCLYSDMSEPKIKSIAEQIFDGKWLFVGLEHKANSGEFNPPPSDGEVWVTVVRKSVPVEQS